MSFSQFFDESVDGSAARRMAESHSMVLHTQVMISVVSVVVAMVIVAAAAAMVVGVVIQYN